MARARSGSMFFALAIGGAIFASALASCATPPDTGRSTEIHPPDFAPGFSGDPANGHPNGVSAFLERRCGTLDCHGQEGRPLRIYGQRGLRLDATKDVPGGTATSPAEQYANWLAVIGVQPEMMTLVENDQGNLPERLLLVRKPRQMERHIGGQVIVVGDDGDTCLVSWLQGATNFDACDRATSLTGNN